MRPEQYEDCMKQVLINHKWIQSYDRWYPSTPEYRQGCYSTVGAIAELNRTKIRKELHIVSARCECCSQFLPPTFRETVTDKTTITINPEPIFYPEQLTIGRLIDAFRNTGSLDAPVFKSDWVAHPRLWQPRICAFTRTVFMMVALSTVLMMVWSLDSTLDPPSRSTADFFNPRQWEGVSTHINYKITLAWWFFCSLVKYRVTKRVTTQVLYGII